MRLLSAANLLGQRACDSCEELKVTQFLLILESTRYTVQGVSAAVGKKKKNLYFDKCSQEITPWREQPCFSQSTGPDHKKMFQVSCFRFNRLWRFFAYWLLKNTPGPPARPAAAATAVLGCRVSLQTLCNYRGQPACLLPPPEARTGSGNQ